jgi:hypothetical protein
MIGMRFADQLSLYSWVSAYKPEEIKKSSYTKNKKKLS